MARPSCSVSPEHREPQRKIGVPFRAGPSPARDHYLLEIAGGAPIAQYGHDIIEAADFGFRPDDDLFRGALSRQPFATCS